MLFLKFMHFDSVISTEQRRWEWRARLVICNRSHRSNVINLCSNSHEMIQATSCHGLIVVIGVRWQSEQILCLNEMDPLWSHKNWRTCYQSQWVIVFWELLQCVQSLVYFPTEDLQNDLHAEQGKFLLVINQFDQLIKFSVFEHLWHHDKEVGTSFWRSVIGNLWQRPIPWELRQTKK